MLLLNAGDSFVEALFQLVVKVNFPLHALRWSITLKAIQHRDTGNSSF